MVILPPPSDSLMAQPVRLTVWVAAAVAAAVLIDRGTRRRPALATPAEPS
jgi:hypothetical protein